MATLFIADLHLDPSRPETISLALQLINDFAPGFETVYILGDFVEYWIGDDSCFPEVHSVFQALSVLADKGVQIYFMHGNRDFLISANYLQQFNISLIDRDSTEVDLHGTKAIIMHGDSLCTDDQDYLAFRSKVRGQAWQAQFLATPVKARLAQMRKLREDSYRATQNKTNQVLDVNRQAVVEQFEQSDAALLIHGHTHRPDVHLLTIGGRPKKRIVLGDWHTHTKVLVCDRNKQELLTWPPG